MFATIITSGQTFPVDALTDCGAYLLILGHARFFASHLVNIAGNN